LPDHQQIQALLEKGVTDGVYPGAVMVVAKQGKVVFFEAVGQASRIPQSAPMKKETIFDLASLTKPLVTTLVLMKLVSDGRIFLDGPLSDILPGSILNDKKDLTLRLILNHAAGFLDWKPFYLDLVKYERDQCKSIIRKWILTEPFAYKPGTRSQYSDPGFILLEWVIEEVCGTSLKQFAETIFFKPLGLKTAFLSKNALAPDTKQASFAATEDCPWRNRVLRGEVHDENAFALGGYSGHAGLFGNAEDVFQLLAMLRAHYRGERTDCFNQDIVKEFFQRQGIVRDSTWALGWDTPSPAASSAGKYFSPNSVGHLGFTGTSIWMDLEKDLFVIILTNRVHPTRDNPKIKTYRPVLHNAVMEGYGI
jgi:CubicO group peptidase (beta-lactamase class C family)